MRLAGVGFNWNGGFYDFVDKKHININKSFSIINDLEIVTKEEKSINSGESYAVLNENIIKNLLGNGSLPIKRSIIQSFKSPVAQLLYTHLDKQLYGTNKYSRTTKGLIQDLGLIAKRYNRLANRKELFLNCKKEILGKETGYGQKINYFELCEGKGKDWIVHVERTGKEKQFDNQKLEEQQQIIKLVSNPQNKATDDECKGQPIAEGGHEKEALKTQIKGNSEQVSKNTKSSQEKKQNQFVKIEHLPQSSEDFLNAFCKSFPHANIANINKSKAVKNSVEKFVEKYQENSINFLEFVLNLSTKTEYLDLINANTPNYLFKYKIGGQLLIDAWTNETNKKVESQADDKLVRKEQNYQIYRSFEAANQTEYNNYIQQLFDFLSDEEKNKFEEYFNSKLNQSLKLISDKKRKKEFKEDFFSDPKNFQYTFIKFSEAVLEKKILTFPQWADKYKKEEYSQVKQYRDTSKEPRYVAIT